MLITISLEIVKKIKSNAFLSFLTLDTLFGRIEHRIINIRIIPPKKIIMKIKLIILIPVKMLKFKKFNLEDKINSAHNFMGLLVPFLAIIVKTLANINKHVIIFLSLIKALTLGVNDKGNNCICLFYYIFFY